MRLSCSLQVCHGKLWLMVCVLFSFFAWKEHVRVWGPETVWPGNPGTGKEKE